MLIHQNWPTNELNPGFFFARANERTVRYLELVMDYELYVSKLPLDPKDLMGTYARDDQVQACLSSGHTQALSARRIFSVSGMYKLRGAVYRRA